MSYFEAISSADLSSFIALQVQSRGLSPKTANRYREILCRLFNWAMNEGGIKLPGDRNPLDRVARYKERAGEIRFLTLQQIDDRLRSRSLSTCSACSPSTSPPVSDRSPTR